MAITLNEFVNEIGWSINEDGLKTGMSSAQNALKKAQPIANNLVKFVSLPLIALGGVAVKMASDAQETSDKYDTIFSSIGVKARKTADTIAEDFGMSGSNVKKMMGDTADMMTGFGFSEEKALELADSVARLGIDLASFTNLEGGASGAVAKLTKGLLGEREGMKMLGIAMTEDVLKEEKLKMAKEGITWATENQAKAEATLRIAIRQSQNAIGDYERTSTSLANSAKRLKQRFGEIMVQLGTVMIPVVNKVTNLLETLANKFIKLGDGARLFVVVALVLTAVIPILILGIIALSLAVMNFGVAMVVATGGLILLIPVLIGFLALITVGVIKFVAFTKSIVSVSEPVKKVGGILGGFAMFLVNVLKVALMIVIAPLKLLFFVAKWVFVGLVKLLGVVVDGWAMMFGGLWDMLVWIGDKIAEFMGFKESTRQLTDFFRNIKSTAYDGMLGFVVAILIPLKMLDNWLTEVIDSLVAKIMKPMETLKELGNLVQEKTKFLDSPIQSLVDLAMGTDTKATYESMAIAKTLEKPIVVPRTQSLPSSVSSKKIVQNNKVSIVVPEGTTEAQGTFLQGVVEDKLSSGFGTQISEALGNSSEQE